MNEINKINLGNNFQTSSSKPSAQSGSANFTEVLKAFIPHQVANVGKNSSAGINLSKWDFEEPWNKDGEEDAETNPYEALARIFRKYSKNKK